MPRFPHPLPSALTCYAPVRSVPASEPMGYISLCLGRFMAGCFDSASKSVIGPAIPHMCPLCRASFPSATACAAHLHKKHSVVNVLTQYTCGTVCKWCHTEHHSTDRLKYHLRTSPLCVHGLRVVVGPLYVPGTGTKRSGPRIHRGLPPLRMPGPVNATPAQRQASLEGRHCEERELRDELQRATGSEDVYRWPQDSRPAVADSGSPPLPADTQVTEAEPISTVPLLIGDVSQVNFGGSPFCHIRK